VAIDVHCPAALIAAVSVHPALSPAPPDAAAVDAALDCGRRPAVRRVPTVRVRAEGVSRPGVGALQWSASVPDARRPRLDAGRLALAAQLAPGRDDAVLLAVGDGPVIIGRAGAPPLLDIALDAEATAARRGPELPLLVNWLFEELLGQRLLDATALVDRGSGSARVVPARPVEADPAARLPAPTPSLRDLTPPVLLAALLVLLWEIVALGRQWHHLARPVAAE
jgi:hypothetical protein